MSEVPRREGVLEQNTCVDPSAIDEVGLVSSLGSLKTHLGKLDIGVLPAPPVMSVSSLCLLRLCFENIHQLSRHLLGRLPSLRPDQSQRKTEAQKLASRLPVVTYLDIREASRA